MRVVLFFCCSALAASGATCENMTALSLPHVSIETASAHTPGEINLPGVPKGRQIPAFCRVAGTIRPSADSQIRFEVWLPVQWNRKFQGIGNGGYAGTIGYGALSSAVVSGYAAASTDTGHTAAAAIDASWALNHPEKIADFGYRAIHETAVAAKSIVHAYYGADPARSYFNSCSNGGRQALMEAQRYPADYDGIVAGAPANDWTHLLSAAAATARAMTVNAAGYFPPSKLPAIESAALAACDKADGVQDGVIEDPRQCRFDPSVLLCKGTETDRCLTEPQLTALRNIYEGMHDAQGRLVFPGLSPGGEAEPGGWADWVTGPGPRQASLFEYGTQFFRDMVYSDPAWQPSSFDPVRDPVVATERLGSVLNAVDSDLTAFRARGGKLILYHGWTDAAIPALNTIRYYETVVSKMGQNSVSGFLRLYMVPGMGHCSGGAGADQFGQGGVPQADRFHDVDAALEAWVEQGSAPGPIITTKYKATKYKAGDAASGIARTRTLCPYPQTARWTGSGSTDEAKNFVCRQN